MHIQELLEADLSRYDAWMKAHGNFWQSLERKKLLEKKGTPHSIVCVFDEKSILASALIEKSKGAMGDVWDIARGPIFSDPEAKRMLLEHIVDDAKRANVIAIHASPITPLLSEGWKPSMRHVYPEATRVIDLTKTDEEILSQMHQKGRYNIRIAEKAQIAVRQGTGDDIETFYQLLTETKDRDHFSILSKAHYADFVQAVPGSFLLIAEYGKKPIAGLIGVVWNGVGIYYYGASSYENRALMAPYLLQWKAIQHCKAQHCHTYDLLGVSKDENVNDSWHGITDFKRKFGGTVVTYPPEQVLVLQPMKKLIVDLKRKLLG